MARIRLTATQRGLVAVVITGAVLIAAIGFAGSYTAVRDLALRKGFGAFASLFPLGIDAGIVVLLALDLLLTWIRIPFPLLRQMAWFLTAATIAFNGAAAWPDPLAVGMHATIPLLFITTIEAARHAIGRIADITADRHIESVRLTRWLLAPAPTFKLWRRMKLWELRSYDHALALERDRLVYQTHLRATHGRRWRRTAPPEALLALELTKYGIPVPTAAPAASEAEPAQPLRQEAATVPVRPGRRRALAGGHAAAAAPAPDAPAPEEPVQEGSVQGAADPPQAPATGNVPVREGADGAVTDTYFAAFCDFSDRHRLFPTAAQLAQHLLERYGVTGRGEVPLSPVTLRRHLPDFERRYQAELAAPSEAYADPVTGQSAGRPGVGDAAASVTGSPSSSHRSAAVNGHPVATPAVEAATGVATNGNADSVSSAAVWPQAPSADPGAPAKSGKELRGDTGGNYQTAGGNSTGRMGPSRPVGDPAYADRRRPAAAVHARLPEPRTQPEPAAEGSVEATTPDYAAMPGREGLQAAYEALDARERAKSIRALAPRLAAVTGLREGTVRIYLGQLRAAERGKVATPGKDAAASNTATGGNSNRAER